MFDYGNIGDTAQLLNSTNDLLDIIIARCAFENNGQCGNSSSHKALLCELII